MPNEFYTYFNIIKYYRLIVKMFETIIFRHCAYSRKALPFYRKCLCLYGLCSVELEIIALLCHQFIMCSCLGYALVGNIHDLVTVADS